MDRTKLFHLVAGLVLVAALVGLDLLGPKLAPETKASATTVLALMLWNVRGWFAKAEAPAPVQPPPLPVLLMLGLFALAGCTPGASSPARDTARATTLLIAQAQKTADAVCAQVAKDTSNAALAKSCADSYDTGRASLLAAEGIVDAWDSADRGSYLCTLAHAVEALSKVADAVRAAGGPTMPPVVVDALTLGSSLAKGCST